MYVSLHRKLLLKFLRKNFAKQLCGELILARYARPPNFVTPRPAFSRPHSVQPWEFEFNIVWTRKRWMRCDKIWWNNGGPRTALHTIALLVETSKAIFYVDLRTFLAKFHKFRSISTYQPFLAMMNISCHCNKLQSMHHNHRYKGISALSLSSYTYWWWWRRRSNVPPHQTTYTSCVQKLQMMKQLLSRHCN